MEIIQNTHNTFQPNISAYYETIQNQPNVLSFEQLLERFDRLKMLHNPSYFKIFDKWKKGILPHPPVVFGLESGAFFSSTSIFFLYKKNDRQILKKLPYKYMSMYLGNKDNKFTNFLATQFSEADWTMIANFSNYCTNKYKTRKAKEERRKTQMIETLLKFKEKLAEHTPVLEFDQLLERHNGFKLFEADRNWTRFHWFRKGMASWKNGKTPFKPILFGTESGLMFGKTGFIHNYGTDRGENVSKRYYQITDYHNINHPDFESRDGKSLTDNELEVIKELGKMMKR